MQIYFSGKIKSLASKLNMPLYAVGGYVRNYLIDNKPSVDIDLSAPINAEEILPLIKEFGFNILCEYKTTGTIVFSDEVGRYEFTSFRNEEYEEGGKHTPTKTTFTTDIMVDALRRDFKCNAVYYDIKEDKIVDVLGGVEDIKNKVISTVDSPEKVFSHDGLRLLRLARFSGELNFKVDKATLEGAKKYASNIKDISVERIYDELKKILVCDSKYSFSNKNGHYDALKILDKTRVLDYIFPELTLGRNMKQREDFHNYDVLEHSLRTVKYADKSIRLSALLHDIAKPYCMQTYGKYYGHDKEGEIIAKDVLTRLKADNRTIREVCFLTSTHMFDLKCEVRESKVRLFIVKNFNMIEKFLLLKQADFSAGKDDLSISPVVTRWKEVIAKMKEEKLPFTVKQLCISPQELMAVGLNKNLIGETLTFLLEQVVCGNLENKKELLIKAVLSQRNLEKNLH